MQRSWNVSRGEALGRRIVIERYVDERGIERVHVDRGGLVDERDEILGI
jgi:hypothetical protein